MTYFFIAVEFPHRDSTIFQHYSIFSALRTHVTRYYVIGCHSAQYHAERSVIIFLLGTRGPITLGGPLDFAYPAYPIVTPLWVNINYTTELN